MCLQESLSQELNCLVISFQSLSSFKIRGEQKRVNRRRAKELLPLGFKLLSLRNTNGKYEQSNGQVQF